MIRFVTIFIFHFFLWNVYEVSVSYSYTSMPYNSRNLFLSSSLLFFFIKTIFYSEISPNFTASPSCFISFYKLSNMFIAWNVSEILYTFLHYVIFVIHIRIGISPQGHHYSTGYIHNELLFLIQLWQLLIFLSFIFNTSLGESIQKVGRKL